MSTTTDYYTPASNASTYTEALLEKDFQRYAEAILTGQASDVSFNKYMLGHELATDTTYDFRVSSPSYIFLIGKLALNYKRDLGTKYTRYGWTDVSNSAIANLFDAGMVLRAISQPYIDANKGTIVKELLALQKTRIVNNVLTTTPLFANVAAIDAAIASFVAMSDAQLQKGLSELVRMMST
jgi:hypothetical protein